jgi:hypothetical protein
VTQRATQLNIPIYTIGLGPAAIGTTGSSAAAVDVMQQLSASTGGAYASLATAGALENAFGALATGLAVGYYVVELRIQPSPAARERVDIRVRAGKGGRGSSVAARSSKRSRIPRPGLPIDYVPWRCPRTGT